MWACLSLLGKVFFPPPTLILRFKAPLRWRACSHLRLPVTAHHQFRLECCPGQQEEEWAFARHSPHWCGHSHLSGKWIQNALRWNRNILHLLCSESNCVRRMTASIWSYSLKKKTNKKEFLFLGKRCIRRWIGLRSKLRWCFSHHLSTNICFWELKFSLQMQVVT